MSPFQDEWLAHQRKRFLRHDAHRFVRPDAQRFLRPGYKHLLPPGFDPHDYFALLEGKANFNPSQPRVPAGNPDGGQWTDQGGGSGQVETDDPIVRANEDDAAELGAIRRRGSLEDCELLYKRDLFQCRMVGSPACYHQALVRYHACQNGLPLPPLSY